MYHVSKDLRARNSAELICSGLEECLKEKPLNKSRINDIYEKCFVSRATFYRLFDNIYDVFAYECDNIFKDIVKLLQTQKFKDHTEQALYCVKRWLVHDILMKALVDNNLIGIFYESHMRNIDILRQFYSINYEDDTKIEYFIYILASLCYASLSMYFKHGAKESIEEVYKTVCESTRLIATNL